MGSRKKAAKKADKKAVLSARLPRAPLAEVVFELRWALQQGPIPQGLMNFDPMIFPLLYAFGVGIAKKGFPFVRDVSHPSNTGPYGVIRRYYKSEELLYPLMQIGSGIFATNESHLYDWKRFKSQVLMGVQVLLDTYPTEFGTRLIPAYLELRYVDVFDKTVLPEGSVVSFAEKASSLKIQLPPILGNKEMFWGNVAGRVVFQRSIRDRKDSLFEAELASAQNAGTNEAVIKLESKVRSTGGGVPALKNNKKFISDVGDWLEFAHDVTSPFFKDFVLPEFMKKFRRT